MPSPRPEVAATRARVAALISHGADAEIVQAARAEHVTEHMADWIRRQLEGAPPLSGEQLARIRAALPPAGVA